MKRPVRGNYEGRMRRLAIIVVIAAVAPALVSTRAARASVLVLTIDGKGWGHGVGMAQDGAYWMGRDGASSPKILGHFYPGTSLGKSSGTVRVAVMKSPSGDAMLQFPAQVKQIAPRWRVGVATAIDDKDVDVVQGNTADGIVVTLYFDQKTGLLTRSIRYTDSPVGRIPVQADYSDYRDVNGVKLPFKFTQTWLDGRDTFELTQIRANGTVDAARFNKPSPSTPPKK